MSFWFSKIAKSKPHDRNEFVTLGIVWIGSRNETETEELLRNETETFWRIVTVSLRIVPAVLMGAICTQCMCLLVIYIPVFGTRQTAFKKIAINKLPV